jgi:outer membrane protein assembly factor BamB/tRNA A-37 threonylcarbamoyl transferase component Bud32
MGLAVRIIVNVEGRRVADENIQGAAVLNSVQQQALKQGNCPKVGLLLGVLVPAIGPVADGAAEAADQELFIPGQLQIQVGTAFHTRLGQAWVVFRVMVPRDIIERDIQDCDKVFQVRIGQITTAQHQIHVLKMAIGCQGIDTVDCLVAHSEDLHSGCIVPQKPFPGKTCPPGKIAPQGAVANPFTAHYNSGTSPFRGEESALETKSIPQPLDSGDDSTSRQQLNSGATLVNRYNIQDVIGVGGMGSVYRARDLHFPNVVKLVAVKEMINMAPDPLVRQTIIQNFEREANLLATLNHASIPRIYDYFSEDNRSYLVLEFIHGKDLEAVITDSSGFMPEDQVISWAVQLCDVLTYLHGHKPDPIIFRDMKPSNVMINHNGDVVLVDFGIAKTFQSGQKGTMIGTEGYSPPEQYRGEATQLEDIYSLGATLHHTLTRRDPRLEPPFSFNERPIRRINPNVSSELETVITTALQYNPSERFPNTVAMRDALMGVARKTGALAKITAALPVKSGGIKPLWVFKCEDEVRSTPVLYQSSLLVGCYDNNLYALNAADGQFQWKYAAEGGIVARPAVFEGNIYFGSEDHRLHVVSARSGKVVWTYYTEGKVRSSPRIAEGHVFFGSDDQALHAVNLNTGRAAWKFETDDAIHSTPFVANELVYVGSESGGFYAIDFRGEMKWRFQAKRAITSSPIATGQAVYFSSADSTLYALDAKNGWAIWRFRLGKGSVSSPALADDFIFLGAADGFIYCVDARTAKEVWRFKTENQVSSSPAVYKDSLYCGSVDGNLYCLEYRTGRLRWKFETKGQITGSPLVFDDIVYIGSTDNHVYALFA